MRKVGRRKKGKEGGRETEREREIHRQMFLKCSSVWFHVVSKTEGANTAEKCGATGPSHDLQ